jgi:hypothetical protein
VIIAVSRYMTFFDKYTPLHIFKKLLPMLLDILPKCFGQLPYAMNNFRHTITHVPDTRNN